MSKIFAHHDADGIVSAWLYQKANGGEIEVVEAFGDTSKWEEDDVMVDMRPDRSDIVGTVIDHHPGHPPKGERDYSLTWRKEPASLITWRLFKDKIPENEWWKTAIGVIGDGQPEKITYDIWESCRQLRTYRNTYQRKSYGKWKISFRPLYTSLSSAINSFMRYGDYSVALDIIDKAITPRDILDEPSVEQQRSKYRKHHKNVMSDVEIYNFGDLVLAICPSEGVRVTGHVASELEGDMKRKTVLAFDPTDSSLSLRGDLALYYQEKLSDITYLNIDGHPGFMGGQCESDPWTLRDDIIKRI